jgi:hypothetical protein
MSRALLCVKCGRRYPDGRWTVPPGPDGPAESTRTTTGRAKTPTTEQRTMTIYTDGHKERTILPLTNYDCDLCNAPIAPRDRAKAVTVWQPSRQDEPGLWETEYLT